MKTVSNPTTKKEEAYAKAQEAVRKDIERAFGVLTAWFHILDRPCRLLSRSDMAYVMQACIILHNMIVEERRSDYDSCMSGMMHLDEAMRLFRGGKKFTWNSESVTKELLGAAFSQDVWASLVWGRNESVVSTVDHFSVKHDLMEHIWARTEVDGYN